MDIVGTLRLSSGALKDRKVRSALTILMVVIGGGLVSSLNGISAGFNAYISDQLGTLAPNLIIVSASAILPRFGESTSQSTPATITDLTVRTIEHLPGVKTVVPSLQGSIAITSAGKKATATVAGIDQSKLVLVYPAMELENGAFVSTDDPSGILLGNTVAHPARETVPFAVVGQTVKVEFTTVGNQGIIQKSVTKARSYIVKGVLKATGNPLTDNSVYVSLRSAASLFQRAGKYDSLNVISLNADSNDAVAATITAIYGTTLQILTPKSIMQTVENVLGAIKGLIFSIAAVSLIVGGVGVITTIYTSVMERTREIGLIKALGFRNRDVMMLFLSESLIIGMLGGAFGILVGMGGSVVLMNWIGLQSASMNLRPVFLLQDIVSVWLLLVCLSGAAGIYPSWRASRLDPVVALRKE